MLLISVNDTDLHENQQSVWSYDFKGGGGGVHGFEMTLGGQMMSLLGEVSL